MTTNSPPRKLCCAVCGQQTQGRQWWNRDTGYGVCIEHGQQAIEREGPEATQRLYGVRGHHWDIKPAVSHDHSHLRKWIENSQPTQL